ERTVEWNGALSRRLADLTKSRTPTVSLRLTVGIARCAYEGASLLRIGLVGLPRAGKSTVFDALVRASGAQALAGRTFAGLTPRVAVVKVPDPRLGVLAEMYHPRKVTPAEVEYSDLPRLAAEAAPGTRQAPAYLAQLRNMDALLHVVAGFDEDPATLPAVMIARLQEGATELALADLQVVEGRLARLD